MRRSVGYPAWLGICAALLGACGSSEAHTQSRSGTTAASTPNTTSMPTTTSTSVPSPGPAARVCGGPGRTVAADARARVYVSGGRVVGCARGGPGPYALGSATSCLGGALAGPFAMSGVRVAFGLKRCGVDTGRSTVVVRRLDSGQVLSQRPATQSALGAESYSIVSDIVLARDGTVAWISQAASIVSRRRATQVHAAGPGGTRILDSGAGIGPRSLRLRGGVVRWRHDGLPRSARLG